MLENNYRGRLYRGFINSASRSFDLLWRMMRPFLSKITIDKVRISREEFNRDIWLQVNRS